MRKLQLEPARLGMHTPEASQRVLAERVRRARVALGFTQSTTAARAGVALPTLRRFERTGEVSLKYLLRICYALGRLDEFDAIFRPPPAGSIADLEAQASRPVRKRGSR
jgi:transcriptional regulator with XRE-family HTH domain